jgi:hypothetical protein
MKTSKLVVRLVATMLVAGGLFTHTSKAEDGSAKENKALIIKQTGVLKYRIRVENQKREKMTVTIYDLDRNVLYDTKTYQDFDKVISFEELPDGKYIVEIENASKQKFTEMFDIVTETKKTISVAKN